ncbi:MAG TPA: hypothetical protein VMW35_16975 [Myxococcota bacterium]|jgi:hypothetical protein|nr:hypothetical protein [Myxococcota bacterium]
MPVLPLIDLLILLGWTSLMVAAALKAVWITTSYRPDILGLLPSDFLIAAGVALLFALSLAARTWVRLHEPRLLRRHRALEPGFDDREERSAPAALETLVEAASRTHAGGR